MWPSCVGPFQFGPQAKLKQESNPAGNAIVCQIGGGLEWIPPNHAGARPFRRTGFRPAARHQSAACFLELRLKRFIKCASCLRRQYSEAVRWPASHRTKLFAAPDIAAPAVPAKSSALLGPLTIPFECPPSSDLARRLRELGYPLTPLGNAERLERAALSPWRLRSSVFLRCPFPGSDRGRRPSPSRDRGRRFGHHEAATSEAVHIENHKLMQRHRNPISGDERCLHSIAGRWLRFWSVFSRS